MDYLQEMSSYLRLSFVDKTYLQLSVVIPSCLQSSEPHQQQGATSMAFDPYRQQPPQYPQQQQQPQPSARIYKMAARRQKSTFIHAILTFCTVGLWSPVWIMACAENARIRRAQAEVAMYQQRQPTPGYRPPPGAGY